MNMFIYEIKMVDKYINLDYQLSLHRNFDLNVTLAHDNFGGIGLFSTKKIKKGSLICFYRITVFDASTYISPTNNIYTFAIFNRSGAPYEHLIGDITIDSFCAPIDNIPFIAMFSNEPSKNQHINAYFDPNLRKNYRMYDRRGYKYGDKLVYNLIALNNINPNEEILTYYGDDYERNYDINISQDDKNKILLSMHS